MASKTEMMNDRAGSATLLGAVVAWDIGTGAGDDVMIPRVELRSLFERHGFDPEVITELAPAEEALLYASRIGWGRYAGGGGQKYPVVQLKAEKGTPASFGVMVRTDETEDATMVIGARIRVNPTSMLPEVLPPLDDRNASEGALKVAEKVAEHARQRMTHAFNSNLVEALGTVVRAGGMIRMRLNSGGAYFVPTGRICDNLLSLLDGIELLTAHEPRKSQFVANVTIVHGDERSLKSWTRQTQASFEQETDALVEELKKMQSRDNVRDSTWEKKRQDVVNLMLRADSFASLLGDKLSTVKDALGQLEREYGNAHEEASRNAGRAANSIARLDALDGLATRAVERKAARVARGGAESPDVLGAFDRLG